MSNIYSEAIAEAKKLKEVAEQNAKNKILESITPRIRMLIEQELAGDEDPIADDMEDVVDDIIDDEIVDAQEGSEVMDEPASSFDFIDDIELGKPDPIEPPMPSFEEFPSQEVEEVSKDKNVNINITVESRKVRRATALRKKAVKLVLELRKVKTKTKKNIILKELNNIRSMLSNETLVERNLKNEILEVIKESTMSRRTRRAASRLNESNKRWLFEEDEELDLEDEELELEDKEVEEEEEDIDVDAIKAAVEELAGAVGMELGEEAEAEAEEEEKEEEEEEELELEEMDEEAMDDMHHEGMHEKDVDAGYMREADKDEKDEKDMKEADDDEIVEINEASLRRALKSMTNRTSRKIRESRRRRRPSNRRRRRIQEGDAKAVAGHFGGGQIVEVDEETLLNALAEELGGAHKEQINLEKAEGGAEKMASHFGGGSAQKALSESRKRTKLAERKAVLARKEAQAAKKELKESNLFNAKLLYVNKLMQQHDMNSKQQRAIVEALDNAKTIREAKLLYTSLTDSLKKRRNTGTTKSSGSLNEGLVGSGSGSNSTRSSAPAKSGVELNRWAILAGIKK